MGRKSKSKKAIDQLRRHKSDSRAFERIVEIGNASSSLQEIVNQKSEHSPDQNNEHMDHHRRRKPGEVRSPPPSPPAALHPNTTLHPPYADDEKLRAAYDVHSLVVNKSSKIESKVRQTIHLLQEGQARKTGGQRHVLVTLVARAPAANKCISVVELVKRELEKVFTGTLYQYTGTWVQLEQFSPKRQREKTSSHVDEGVMEDNTEDVEVLAFESVDPNTRPKVRNASCLAIYLALKSIPKLRDEFGQVWPFWKTDC